MTVQPDKPSQIKRDYQQLINLYPAATPANEHYLSKLNHQLQDWCVSQSQQKLLVLGQIGLGNGLELLSVIHGWREKHHRRLLIKVFEPHPINAYELKSLWDQSQSLITRPHLIPIAEAIIHAQPARIVGCQRLIFDDAQITLDLHFGDITDQLSNLPHCLSHPIEHWLVLPHLQQQLAKAHLWQMARLSADNANILGVELNEQTQQAITACGFGLQNLTQTPSACVVEPFIPPASRDEILLHERRVLRQKMDKAYAFNPLAKSLYKSLHKSIANTSPIAIIGGGLASAHLALSFAERGQTYELFCKDNELGQGASGNRQGAIYPLLTPENDELSRFFQQAFLFSRRRVQSLTNSPCENQTPISHDFCGVLQTGHDDRSQQRLDKIIHSQAWPREIAYSVDADEANRIANIGIDKSGFFYPLGGWVCPFEYAKAALQKAQQLAEGKLHLETEILEIEHQSEGWYLIAAKHRFGPFSQLVLANGAELTQFDASHRLQISPFRGQVSHVPAQFQLSQLATVLCANGYLTPSHQGLHCLGASYVKEPKHLDFCPQEQQENLAKMHESYPQQDWLEDINISGNSARVGVRMVTRDHFPMLGCAPDVSKILKDYQQHQLTKDSGRYWQTTPAPVLPGLFILGGLGSRGLSSGPLAAECLAAQLCGEPIPLDWQTLCKLNPNRMWLRKLLKGKAL